MGGLFGGGQDVSISAPVVSSVRIQTSAFGRCIPLVYGWTRIAGNLGWYNDFTAIPHTTTQDNGGGGKGGGGGTTSQTDYTYTAAAIMFLCEGQIGGIDRVWADKSQYTIAGLGLSVFPGSVSQTPFSYVQTTHPDQALGYRRVAYVASGTYDLGSNAQMPNHTFEVQALLPFSSSILDANIADIIPDYLSHPVHGVGFPASQIGSLTQLSNYCVASGIFVSPAYIEQQQASEHLTRLAKIANSALLYSEGILKVLPYGDVQVTGNGVTFTPNTTPEFELSDDDFLDAGEDDPVVVSRGNPADAFNQVQVKYYNRDNQYNEDIAEAKDQAAIELFGLRPMQPVELHEICDQDVAYAVAQLILQRALYIRNTYRFKLGWRYAGLEPMDIVTLTEGSGDGLDRVPVRITVVEEDEDGNMSIEAEDYLGGVSSHVAYPSQAPGGYTPNYNATPGNGNAPIVFEAPDVLTAGAGLEVWIGASGGPLWGGADVWASTDGDAYKWIGRLSNPVRQGILTADLPATADPDTGNTLSVDLSISRGTMTGGTKTDADSFNTLCYVDGELISYQTASLVSANKYALGYLRRGAYNSTIGHHQAGAQFARVDSPAFLRFPFTVDRIGTNLSLKLLSFNVYGSGHQELQDVQPVTYKISGYALQSPLPNVLNPVTRYVAGLMEINWDAVSDFRQPNVDYEIRKGDTWDSAKVLGRTSQTSFTAVGNGNYWIAAHYLFSGSLNVYSLAPTEVIITGAALESNVIATFDEAGLGWAGTLGANTIINGGEVMLGAAGNILTDPDFLNNLNVLWYGGVAASGSYTLPAGHVVDVGRVAPCMVAISYTARGQSILDNVLNANDFLGITDLFGSALAAKINVQPQIAIAGNDGIFGAWQNFLPGTYNARYFKARVLLSTSDGQVTAVLSDLVFSVDVPDRLDSYSITVASVGQSVTFSAPFNGGPGAGGNPAIQVTILNAVAGDDVVVSSISKTGCNVQILNGGVGVVRAINLQAQGY
jgi:hypothetical protein